MNTDLTLRSIFLSFCRDIELKCFNFLSLHRVSGDICLVYGKEKRRIP